MCETKRLWEFKALDLGFRALGLGFRAVGFGFKL